MGWHRDTDVASRKVPPSSNELKHVHQPESVALSYCAAGLLADSMW